MQRTTSLTPLVLLLACAGPDEGDSLEATDTVDEPRIATENPNGSPAEIIARRYLVDPDVTAVSYAATGIVGGCSATLIGPNLVLTAAHCGFKSHLFGFQTYRERDPLRAERETVQCNPLYQTFADTDMLLMHCPAINGINPGDKFGYVDLDPRAAADGDQVYSLWKNPVDDVGGGEHMLFSSGEVIDDEAEGWMTPDGYDCTAILTNLFGIAGASGSSQISADRHEILVGPLSVAPSGGGDKRWSLSMLDYRLRAEVRDASNVDAATVIALGLDPAAYVGGTDKDGDLQLDIQTDLERATGEAPRDHYTLSFSSERKNPLWTVLHNADFRPDDQLVYLDAHGGVDAVERLRHERLGLSPSTEYRVSVMVLAGSTTSAGLEIGFDGDFGQYGWAPVDSQAIDLVAGAGWVMHSFALKSSYFGNTGLTIRTRPGAKASIAAINVIEGRSTMDFDTFDKRYHWRNDNNGARAFILPDGTDPGVDWAAAVPRNNSIASGNDWPLRSRQLALVGGQHYQMCFDFRKYAGAVASPITGHVRVKSNNSVVYSQAFSVTATNWNQLCTDDFMPIGSDNILQFGIDAPPPDQGVESGAIYLVDDIQIDAI